MRLALRIEAELPFLARAATISDLTGARIPDPGVCCQLIQPVHTDEVDLAIQLTNRVGGGDLPPWADGSGGSLAFGVCLCRVKDVFHTPKFGALITSDGAVLKSSVAEALYVTPDLSALPGVQILDGRANMQLPSLVRSIPRGTVFMAWGGRFNYGHFLLDCLPALVIIADQGLLQTYPPVAPKLTSWHKTLLELMLGSGAPVIEEVDDDVVALGDALFATPMDHFLHAPGPPLEHVRSRILSRVAVSAPGAERVYLSRRKDEKRPMLNELELELRLQALGFVIVHPRDVGVQEQIAMFRDAKVIVGPTGAAFANCLFCAPKAKVFEIQPTNYLGVWVRGLCHHLDVEWYGYFAPSPLQDQAAQAVLDASPGAMFAWSTPVDSLMKFIEDRIGDDA